MDDQLNTVSCQGLYGWSIEHSVVLETKCKSRWDYTGLKQPSLFPQAEGQFIWILLMKQRKLIALIKSTYRGQTDFFRKNFQIFFQNFGIRRGEK